MRATLLVDTVFSAVGLRPLLAFLVEAALGLWTARTVELEESWASRLDRDSALVPASASAPRTDWEKPFAGDIRVRVGGPPSGEDVAGLRRTTTDLDAVTEPGCGARTGWTSICCSGRSR
ncbi:hypothetical protein ABZ490_35065 [Streptomyces sp. NPDC005811]|uniref:hypothetical protein n=1 Tax=Streptomyces sp. NPDC005811 TaxID=3154565 RepID=UPI0033CB8A73